MEVHPYTAVSLFSGGGIGDLALRAAGAELLVASELREDRAQVLAANFPEAEIVTGDIEAKLDAVLQATQKALGGRRLDVLFATPPCQGMSKNGRGKLLNAIRQGLKPELDVRNQLILHALTLATSLKPRLVVFENVPEMQNTLIADRDGSARDILEIVREELGRDYAGGWEVVEFADFGVPQRRQRLITVFSSESWAHSIEERGGSFIPPRTHAQSSTLFLKPWVSVLEALEGVPPLDAKSKESATSEIPLHRVPLLDEDKYFWVSNTPPNQGAFDNQCVNPECNYQDNPTHSARHDSHGINRARKDTPLRCARCGELLPRPWVREGENYRLMSGYTSAYRRMRGDLPASALTRNLSYACSDQKVHPTENRVLSLHEACIIHTISDFEFRWERADGKKVSDKTIREIIGESIPPRGLEIIFRHLLGRLEAQHKGDSEHLGAASSRPC